MMSIPVWYHVPSSGVSSQRGLLPGALLPEGVGTPWY